MERIRRPRGSGHQSYKGPTSVAGLIAAIFVLLSVIVTCAILFAPRKPQAPPASAISYEKKPDAHFTNDGGSDDDSRPINRRQRRHAKVEPPKPEESTGRYKIYGVVTDDRTGEPIKDALIRCSPVDLMNRIEDLNKGKWTDELEKQREALMDKVRNNSGHGHSDENGAYSIRVDERCEYQFVINVRGYISQVDVKASFEENSEELHKDFRLSTGASVSGRVTESGGSKGAEGVTVWASTSDGIFNNDTVTDKNGNYTVSGLRKGEAMVSLRLNDCPYIVTGAEPTKNVTIKTDTQDVRGVDFTVEPAGTVWGYVMTRDNQPLKNIDVVLCTGASIISQIAEASLKQSAPVNDNSEEDGYYEVVGVPLNKEWKLYAMAKEQAPQMTAPFILTSNQRTARIDIFIMPGSTVYGRVVDTDRAPVPGAEVICIPSYTKFFAPLDSPQAFRNQHTGEDGTFTIPQLPAGEYQILAQKRGYKFAAMGEPIYPDGVSEIKNVEVTLTSVESGQFSVYGVVTDASGAALPNVMLTLNSMSGDDLAAGENETTTDSGGNYTFQGVQSGYILLRAEKPGYQGQTVTNVKLDGPTNIVMQAGATLRGKVLVRETNAPPDAAQVTAVRIAGASGNKSGMDFLNGGDGVKSASVDGSGNFSMEVDSGSYMLEARAPGLTSGRTQVSVEAGETRDDVVIFLRKAGGHIQGRVTVANGKSPAGALVWLTQSDLGAMSMIPELNPMGQQRGIQVGEDGVFDFSNLSAGSYIVRASLDGYAQGSSSPVDVPEGQNVSGIQIVLRAGGALEGYVSMNGKTESGAIVTIVGNGVTKMATSDSSGYYHIEQIPEGSYMASAVSFSGSASSLFAPLHARVEISDGVTTQYNFGDTTDTRLTGLCTPPPKAGTFGYAVLHLTDGPTDISSLNFSSPASWFQDSSDMASYIVGMASVDTQGYFEMNNLVGGQYLLDVFYANLAEIMSGSVHRVYSGTVTIENGKPTELEIPTSGG